MLPIRPVIVLQAFPKEVKKGQMVHLACRLYDKKTMQLQTVSRIYLEITSLKDGHTVWELGVIRKNTNYFDIGIGTVEMKEGHEYLVRVSNNYTLSPSASTTFSIKKKNLLLPVLLLLSLAVPLALSPLFKKKYSEKGVTNTRQLVSLLKSEGQTDSQIQEETERILKQIDMTENIVLPVDIVTEIVRKKWITQVDGRVCEFCIFAASSGKNNDGVWDYNDPDAPKIPLHYNCRCSYELEFIRTTQREYEFRNAAIMSQYAYLEKPLQAISIISNMRGQET